MRLERAALEPFALHLHLRGLPRIIASRHAANPAGAGFGSGRFSSPNGRFRTLYAAADFQTALAEVVLRDRFVGRRFRRIHQATLQRFCATEISSLRPLKLLDLTGDRVYRLGFDSDAVRARTHDPGQRFAEALVDQTDFEGVVYLSRLTDNLCYAVFGDSLRDLHGADAVPLTAVLALVPELKRLDVAVVRSRRP